MLIRRIYAVVSLHTPAVCVEKELDANDRELGNGLVSLGYGHSFSNLMRRPGQHDLDLHPKPNYRLPSSL